ncbi:MAG: Lrp/AsnC family transcriptional regulator [Caldilineaceae bacterium]|nr:Lrp/AsnC family transcriptional regulator [Caldilineaceae bacterium]
MAVAQTAITLDHADHAIIQALKTDARMPYSQIATDLGVSPGMVRQRVQRMTEAGVLQLVAVTNPLNIGYHTMALIGVKADGHRLQEIARAISAFEEVIYLTICSAAYNLLVEVTCLDNSHLLTFLTEKLYSVEGVRDTETFIYLDIVKEIYTWDPPPLPNPANGSPVTHATAASDQAQDERGEISVAERAPYGRG